MSEIDRERWDERYREREVGAPSWPKTFARVEAHVPTAGRALDVACGQGNASLWLAARGLRVTAIDVSPVAISTLTERAEALGLDGVTTRVVDLDVRPDDLGRFDLIVCHLFRDPSLDEWLIDHLADGGILALAALSEVGAEPGAFRVASGSLLSVFAAMQERGELIIIDHDEGDGVAWIACKRTVNERY